jgi:hypothetical protein
MVMIDHVDATIFCVHLGSGETLGCPDVSFEWSVLPASCMCHGALGVATPLFRFLPVFSKINQLCEFLDHLLCNQ